MTTTGSTARRYRLSLDGALETFRPELEFVCRFLDVCHPLEHADDAEAVLHYGANPPPGAVHVPSALFPAGVHLDENGIHPNFSALERIEEGHGGVALLAPANGEGAAPPSDAATGRVLEYDALGLIFLLVSRLEGRASQAVGDDRYGRFPLQASLLYRRSRPDSPLADHAARAIAAALLDDPEPANRSDFRVWLTHDVDRLRGYHRPLDPLGRAARDVVFRRAPVTALRHLQRTYLGGEPWRSSRQIMDLSERHGFTSRFYFMGPSEDRIDSPYLLREPAVVRRLSREMIERGHVVGFHPGFRTYRNAEEWNRQRRGLEKVLGHEVIEGRHHRMMFDAETTWDTWDEAGMERDFSLGYPEHSGFPSGTCRAHPTYSLRRRCSLNLLEYPTNLLDFGFFGGRYRDLSADQALAESRAVIDVSRRFGGDLAVLYHTGTRDAQWLEYYESLLEVLAATPA